MNTSFDEFLQSQEEDFDIHILSDWLRDIVRECKDDQKIANRVNYQGCIDECNLLLRIVQKDYLKFNDQ